MAHIRALKKLADAGSFTGLKFYKTPMEISQQCSTNITELEKDIADTREKAEEICKKHDLTFSEVFEEELTRLGGRDPYSNQATESIYMTKATSNVAPTKANQSLLQKIQEDMNQLGSYARQVIASQNEINNLHRIVNHIEAHTIGDKTLELTYAELVELGFD